ncbi:hypothetical protein [Streptomyces justiciae]|uniref:Uncharacterized protein n=1 Tax=Streptomyces justiciae TaxID=2780140 RepID=A0ABU3M858_9ACTN|nr:hypothetical protein [Streptomyces justiciae]MDT7847711.1 hypothetical protein [Streptomyces justiciae]
MTAHEQVRAQGAANMCNARLWARTSREIQNRGRQNRGRQNHGRQDHGRTEPRQPHPACIPPSGAPRLRTA